MSPDVREVLKRAEQVRARRRAIRTIVILAAIAAVLAGVVLLVGGS